VEDHRSLAKADDVAVLERSRARQPYVPQERAVLAAEVLEREVTAFGEDARVTP
jgi:hypothetical protein